MLPAGPRHAAIRRREWLRGRTWNRIGLTFEIDQIGDLRHDVGDHHTHGRRLANEIARGWDEPQPERLRRLGYAVRQRRHVHHYLGLTRRYCYCRRQGREVDTWCSSSG